MERFIHGEAYFRNFTVVFYSLTVDVVFSCFNVSFFNCYVFYFLDVFVSLFSLSRTETI